MVKKKVVSAMLATTMMAALLSGCGSSKAGATNGGKVLNISCWNEEFKSRITAHYPGYVEVDAKPG